MGSESIPPSCSPLGGGAPAGFCAPLPHPGPSSARRNSGNARVGGGAGGPRACRLLPGRSRCPRAGPAARRGAEGGVRWGGVCVWGVLFANTRGAVAAVGEMEPGREGEALWDGKQGPCRRLVPVLLACCVRGHLSGDLAVSASTFPILRKSGQKP